MVFQHFNLFPHLTVLENLRVLFMDYGQIIEQNTPGEFFSNPRHKRSNLFLSQILHYQILY